MDTRDPSLAAAANQVHRPDQVVASPVASPVASHRLESQLPFRRLVKVFPRCLSSLLDRFLLDATSAAGQGMVFMDRS